MIPVFIFALLLGTATTEQVHYSKCKEEGFAPKTCEFEKKLCKLDSKNTCGE